MSTSNARKTTTTTTTTKRAANAPASAPKTTTTTKRAANAPASAPNTTPAATTAPAPSAPKAAASAPKAAATATATPLYKLSAAGVEVSHKDNSTLQLADTAIRAGRAWRAVNGTAKPNTRAIALGALPNTPSTWDTLKEALLPLHKDGLLGSGTPQSYLKAFLKSGYIVPSK